MTASDHLSRDQFGYQGGHMAPGRSDDFPRSSMDDPEDVLPGYHERPRDYHTTGYPQVNMQSGIAMAAAKGRPERSIKVYRSMPDNGQGINPGDWVTPSRRYAEIHRESNGKPDWVIAEKRVPARHLYSEGNSIAEWGYDPD